MFNYLFSMVLTFIFIIITTILFKVILIQERLDDVYNSMQDIIFAINYSPHLYNHSPLEDE